MESLQSGMNKKKEISEYTDKILSLKPLESIEEIEKLVKPLPKYIGPGQWFKLLK